MARSYIATSTGLRAPMSGVTYPLTISCWFRDTMGGSDDRNMVQIADTGTTSNFFRMSKAPGDQRLTVRDHGSGSQAAATTANFYTANVWNHALTRRPASNRHFAILNNGTEVVSTTNLTPSGIDEISVGFENDSSPDDSWIGDLAEVGVWDSDLNADEITALSLGFSPILIRPASLIFYAPLRGGVANGNDKIVAGQFAGILTDDSGNIGLAVHPAIIYPNSTTPIFKGVSAPGGLSIPVAMNSYKRRRQCI